MLLLFSVRVAELPAVLERAVHSVLLCVSFVNVYQFACVLLSLLVSRVGCGI